MVLSLSRPVSNDRSICSSKKQCQLQLLLRIADAGHALTDLVSDFMTLGTVAWALKPPTARFPSGYGKIESIGSLGVSLLLTGGLLMGLNASDVLCSEFFDFHLFSAGAPGGHSHAHPVSLNAMWLAAGSIVVKEWLYRASKLCHESRK